MGRWFSSALAILLMAARVSAEPITGDVGNVIVVGAGQYLSAGAAAIRAGRYDDGIRLTLLGLERDAPSIPNRAAGLANLCAAYVAKEEPDPAIAYCTESLGLNSGNWRAYSNRAHAYLLKNMFAEAKFDNDTAAAIAPNADHVRMVREALNETGLQPQIIVEEHQ
jgi:tetratricopeptide (TPR) repeat protein